MFSCEIFEFFRSRHRRCFMKKALLKHIAINITDLQLYWNETPILLFSSEYCEIFKDTYFKGHLLTVASDFFKKLPNSDEKPEYRNGERNAGNVRNVENVIFRGMSPNILWNILKYSGECRQTFREMSSNIPGNVAKYSGECRKTFRGIFFKHSPCSE